MIASAPPTQRMRPMQLSANPQPMRTRNLPIACRPKFMQVLAALLAEIFVGARFFSHDPDTAAVLPDLADVALHKQPSRIVGDVGREERILAEGVLETVL